MSRDTKAQQISCTFSILKRWTSQLWKTASDLIRMILRKILCCSYIPTTVMIQGVCCVFISSILWCRRVRNFYWMSVLLRAASCMTFPITRSFRSMTHPTMVIPELIRLLVERGLEMDDAIEAVRRSCAYTNHTILAEALEKWPVDYLKNVVPQLIPIIEVLDDKVRRKFDNPEVHIIDKDECVHMANIDIHYSISVNGVASLHTDILKKIELKSFLISTPKNSTTKPTVLHSAGGCCTQIRSLRG